MENFGCFHIFHQNFFIANAESIVKLLALALTNRVTNLAKTCLGWGKISKIKTKKQMEISICRFSASLSNKLKKAYESSSEVRLIAQAHAQADRLSG